MLKQQHDTSTDEDLVFGTQGTPVDEVFEDLEIEDDFEDIVEDDYDDIDED